MSIRGILNSTGSTVIDYMGRSRFNRQQRKTLVKAIAQSTQGTNPASSADGLNRLRQSLAKPLNLDSMWLKSNIEQVKALLEQIDNHYQFAIHSTVDRLFGTHYEKHIQTLGGPSAESSIPPMVKQRNRQAGYAGVALMLALSGAPLLVVTSFAINAYLGAVVIKIGLKDMREKRKLTSRGRNALFYIAVLLSGLLVVQSAMLLVSMLFEKLMATVQVQSQDRLATVFGELPQRVWRIVDGVVIDCPLADVAAGDVVVVYAGEVIPVDGEIVAGHAGVDQHALTGEAQPVELETGDSVFASTLVLMGEIQVRVSKANAETLAAQITEILNNTRNYQTKSGLRGIQMADDLVYFTTGLGLLALPLWGVSAMLSVWAVPVGIMLMATTPLNLMAYLDMSARSNILIKDGQSLDLLSSIDTVVFDKTGTLTEDQPTVCTVHVCGEIDRNSLLSIAAAMEQRQSHPIAAAIRMAAEQHRLALPEIDSTRIEVGYGLAVNWADEQGKARYVRLGSRRYMALNNISVPSDIDTLVQEREKAGHSLVYLAIDDVLQGAIELKPTVRPEAKTVVDALHQRGIETVMITGDQEVPAMALATVLGIDRVFANVLPEQKANLVQELQEQGRQVMFVGDGINDSIALKQAHVSVSISGATTVATDTAQIVLMDGTLSQFTTLFELAERYEANLKRLYVLGVHVPAAHLAAIMAFGMGLASTYAIGFLISLANLGVAFGPIWRQEQLEARSEPRQLPSTSGPTTSTAEGDLEAA